MLLSLCTHGLLHILHTLLLLELLLVGQLQDSSYSLLGFQVLGHATIGASHFTERKIGILVLAIGALVEALPGNLVEEVRVHFHLRLGGKDRVRALWLLLASSKEVHTVYWYLFLVYLLVRCG
jgi:hypothetical protein